MTKYRHKVFTDTHLRRMEEIMRAVAEGFECEIVEFNGENNHVHPLVNFPPKVALSKLVDSLKGVSSRRLRQEYPNSCGTTGGRNDSGPARTSPGRSAGPRCRSSVSTSSSKIVRCDLRVGALLRIASPPP